jgi:hypothetical protein
MIYRNSIAVAMLAAAVCLGAARAPAHDLMPPTGLETGACTHRSRVAFCPTSRRAGSDANDPERSSQGSKWRLVCGRLGLAPSGAKREA